MDIVRGGLPWHTTGACALVSLLACHQAQAFDVHGVRLGDRWDVAKLEQAMSYVTIPASQRFKCRDDGEQSCTGSTRYLVADVRLTVEGRDSRVSRITMTLPTEDFEGEITALKREFGQPTAEWMPSPDVTTPQLFRHRVDWRLPQEELFALKFSTMATISLTTPQDSPATRYPPPG
jgi:hypothetical protein